MSAQDDMPVNNTGFPSGYFRVRAAGTENYLSVLHDETNRDGNALCLWHLDRKKDSYVRQIFCPHTSSNEKNLLSTFVKIFFINPWGALCCKHGGVAIDVISTPPGPLRYRLRFDISAAVDR
jgi:hypothetical protein